MNRQKNEDVFNSDRDLHRITLQFWFSFAFSFPTSREPSVVLVQNIGFLIHVKLCFTDGIERKCSAEMLFKKHPREE